MGRQSSQFNRSRFSGVGSRPEVFRCEKTVKRLGHLQLDFPSRAPQFFHFELPFRRLTCGEPHGRKARNLFGSATPFSCASIVNHLYCLWGVWCLMVDRLLSSVNCI